MAHATKFIMIAVLFFCSRSAFAQTDKEEKEVAVIELGAATNWNFKGGGSSFGPTVAAEVTPSRSGSNWKLV